MPAPFSVTLSGDEEELLTRFPSSNLYSQLLVHQGAQRTAHSTLPPPHPRKAPCHLSGSGISRAAASLFLTYRRYVESPLRIELWVGIGLCIGHMQEPYHPPVCSDVVLRKWCDCFDSVSLIDREKQSQRKTGFQGKWDELPMWHSQTCCPRR